jgi:enoyl-CoA hydratase/carnithine racemase
MALARTLAAGNPQALRAAKRLLNAASPVEAARVLQMESAEQQKLIGSPNQREAVMAGMEGRPARFENG